MKNKTIFSFSTKIIFIVFLSILIPLTVTLTLFFSTYNSMVLKEAEAVSRQQVNFLTSYFDDSFHAVNRNLITWMNTSDIQTRLAKTENNNEEPEYIKNSLVDLCTFQSDYLNAYLYFPKQEQLYYAFNESIKTDYYDITSSDWILSVSGIYDFQITLYPFGLSPALACIIPLRDSGTSAFLGYCMVKLPIYFLNNVFSICDYPYGDLYCLNSSGEVLYTNSDVDILPIPFESLEKSGGIQKTDGYLVYCSPIPQSDLLIISICPNSIFEFSDTRNFVICITLSIFCIIISLTFSTVLLKRILRPIRTMATEMAFADPNALKPMETTNRQDEIGILEQTYNDMIHRINDMLETQYRFQIAMKDAHLRALQLQINPHFVNNTLQMIATMAMEHDMMEIYDLIGSFSHMFYYSLKYKEGIVLLQDELEYLKDYIKIQNGRFPGKFTFFSEIDPKTTALEIPKMSLQPLIENSFEHSFPGITRDWRIGITSCYYGDYYEIVISDNGCGITVTKLDQLRRQLNVMDMSNTTQSTSSIGIQNVNTRIKLLYGKEYGLRIDSKEMQGTKVIVTLPVRKGDG